MQPFHIYKACIKVMNKAKIGLKERDLSWSLPSSADNWALNQGTESVAVFATDALCQPEQVLSPGCASAFPIYSMGTGYRPFSYQDEKRCENFHHSRTYSQTLPITRVDWSSPLSLRTEDGDGEKRAPSISLMGYSPQKGS